MCTNARFDTFKLTRRVATQLHTYDSARTESLLVLLLDLYLYTYRNEMAEPYHPPGITRGEVDARARILDNQGNLGRDIEGWRLKIILTEAIRADHDTIINSLVASSRMDAGLRYLWLSEAAARGRVDYVESLLDFEDVNPDLNKAQEKTPLTRAAENGHLAIVQLLLESGKASHDARGDQYQRDALSYAAGGGHDAIVKLLLNHGAAPDVPDRNGRTPLSHAAEHGHEKAVEIFVDIPVRIGFPDKDIRTPFWHAAASGYHEVCDQLIATGKVNVDSRDCHQMSPVVIAVMKGQIGVVDLFLDPLTVDESIIERNGGDMIRAAVNNNDEEILRLLVSSDKIPVDNREENYEDEPSPFGTAVLQGYSGVARILAQTGKVDMVPMDWEQFSYLDVAINRGDVEMVRLLLEYEQVNPNKHSPLYRTPLIQAVVKGDAEVVQLLLNTGRVDPNCNDHPDGRTALMLAAFYGYTEIMEILLPATELNIEAKDKCGMTALACAAEQGRDECIRLLFKTGRVEANTREIMGRTPLSLAAERGHLSTVRLLLEEGGADPLLADVHGTTPHDYASQKGHMQIAALLSGA